MGILGYVSNIDADTITVTGISYGFDEVTIYTVQRLNYPVFNPPFFGDLTSGSPIITNVEFSAAQGWQAGDNIYGEGIPTGARVVSTTSNTLTMSLDATATLTRKNFWSVRTRMTLRGSSTALGGGMPTGFVAQKGDIIWNEGLIASNDTTIYWICTAPGKLGGSTEADWLAVTNGQWHLDGVLISANRKVEITEGVTNVAARIDDNSIYWSRSANGNFDSGVNYNDGTLTLGMHGGSGVDLILGGSPVLEFSSTLAELGTGIVDFDFGTATLEINNFLHSEGNANLSLRAGDGNASRTGDIFFTPKTIKQE